MRGEHNSAESKVVADLNDLLQLDHDAVEAYTIAIDLARDERIRETLVDFRADHKRHIEELAGLIRDRGGLPLEMPHPTGPLKLAVQTLGAVASDDALLLAFKAVEGQVRDKYQRFAARRYPEDVAAVVRRAAADERKHYDWVEDTLRQRGIGEGTVPHTLASAVEGIHKAIADPLERVQRKVTEKVGEVVGTTRTRRGSEAPSPRDVAAGMAARAREMDDDEPAGTRAAGASPRSEAPDDRSPIVGPSGRSARDELRDELSE